jgi:hypothetical protein
MEAALFFKHQNSYMILHVVIMQPTIFGTFALHLDKTERLLLSCKSVIKPRLLSNRRVSRYFALLNDMTNIFSPLYQFFRT